MANSQTTGGAKRAADRAEATHALVAQLTQAFCEQVRRSLHVDLDGSITSLAFVDHYLTRARDETREPILSLLAAGAGAYFGELVGREVGASWIGDGANPRRLRLLLAPAFVHFSPVDQALEAILGESPADDDPRVAPGPPPDASFQLDARAEAREHAPARVSEAAWIDEQLARLPAIPADQFHTLTTRFETLQLIVELLATRRHHGGEPPRSLTPGDYLEALTGAPT